MNEEEWRVLEEATRRQIQLERMVRDAISKEEEKKEKKGRSFFKHPLMLLLAGSFLTAVVGNCFATRWQLQQWRVQQRHNADAQTAKDMRQLQFETAETIAESFAAADDVLHLFFWPWAKKSDVVTLSERGKQWNEASRKWRVSEKVLSARLRSEFGDDVARSFLLIVEKRRQMGNDIINLLSYADATPRPNAEESKEIDATKAHALKVITEVTGKDGDLTRLLNLMEDRILADERKRQQSPPRITFWN